MTHRRPRSVLALLPLLLLGGCDMREELSVWETKLRFAESIQRGAEVGTAWTMHADRFDEEQGVLLAIRLDDGYGRYYFAERAHIIVDPAQDTVSLRLENVIAAVAEADDQENSASGVYEADAIVTEPVRLPYNVTP